MNSLTSLPAVISTEFIKLKKCKVLWGVPLCSLCPVMMIYIMYAFNKKYPVVAWSNYFSLIETITNLLVAVGIFAVLTGYIFSREYQENTINSMFTYPISRVQFFAGKLVVMLILIFITFVSSFILSVLFGLTIKHETLTVGILLYYLKTYLLMVLMHFSLVPIMAFLSIYNKSIIPPIIVGVIAITLNLIIINTPFNTLFPWSIPVIMSPHEDGRTYTNYARGITVLCVTFIFGILLSIKSIKKDVN